MTGWLIVNHFIQSEKFEELFVWLERAAQKRGIGLVRKTNAQLMLEVGRASSRPCVLPDFVLFWDKDIHLARYLETLGLRLFNTPSAIERCDDKALTHITLQAHGIEMPSTIIAPKTFPRSGYKDYGFLETVAKRLGFPLVVKECFGSFGQQVYLARSHKELEEIAARIQIRPMLFQEFVGTSFARDVRLHIVGGRCVAAMRRWSTTGDFRANVTNGGHMQEYQPTDAQIKMAVDASSVLGLDFSGVDILFGENDSPLLCEVNSNAHFINLYNCTGINVADAIIEHIALTVQK